mgnify:FL=1
MAVDLNYEKDSKERIPYEHYLEVYQNADPAEISSRCNVPYDAEKHEFTVSLMGVSYRISWPEYRVQHLGDDGTDGPVIGWYPLEEKPNAKILVLRYLTEGGAAPSTGKFLTYREIPWGEVYFKQFQGRCLFRLAFGFGGSWMHSVRSWNVSALRSISSGDVGYELEFMKGLFVRLILWAGDDEFPPSAQILFSDNFPAAFTQGEDMAVVGDVTIDMLKALAAK